MKETYFSILAIQDYRRKEVFEVDSDSDYHSSSDSSSGSENGESAKEEDSSDSSGDSGKDSEEFKPSCRRSLRFQRPLAPATKKRGKDLNYVNIFFIKFFTSPTKSNNSIVTKIIINSLKQIAI